MNSQCGGGSGGATTIYIASEYPTGSAADFNPPYGCTISGSAITINDFIGASVWDNKELTTPESLQPNNTVERYYSYFGNIHGVDERNDFIVMYGNKAIPGTPDYDPTNPNAIKRVEIMSGSLTCASPNTCNP